MSKHLVLAALASSVLLGGCVHADPERDHRYYDDRHYDDRYYDDRRGDASLSLQFTFTNRERIYLNDYYRRNLPPGLAKQGKIPPGHAKRLARGMPWPPGVPYYSLPHYIERDLQPLPRGYARFIVGPDIVIVDLGARIIVDAFRLDL
ncbi:hypothetical protein [Thiofaba sp. EF100]|jgi:hypothetical protein|uniref:hypothetical protein n=1 Tax=Thiofaba sp. EF100 TaxID=3121274 RepID=UPI003221DC36